MVQAGTGSHLTMLNVVFLFINTLMSMQYGVHFADDNFKFILLNENSDIKIQISPKFNPGGSINNDSALVEVVTWRRNSDLPQCWFSSMTHVCPSPRPGRWQVCNKRMQYYGQMLTQILKHSIDLRSWNMFQVSSSTHVMVWYCKCASRAKHLHGTNISILTKFFRYTYTIMIVNLSLCYSSR